MCAFTHACTCRAENRGFWCRITEFSNVVFRTVALTRQLTEAVETAFQTYGLLADISFPAFIAGAVIGNLAVSINHALC